MAMRKLQWILHFDNHQCDRMSDVHWATFYRICNNLEKYGVPTNDAVTHALNDGMRPYIVDDVLYEVLSDTMHVFLIDPAIGGKWAE